MRFTIKQLSGRTRVLHGNMELTADAAASQVLTRGLLCLLKAQSGASVNIRVMFSGISCSAGVVWRLKEDG